MAISIAVAAAAGTKRRAAAVSLLLMRSSASVPPMAELQYLRREGTDEHRTEARTRQSSPKRQQSDPGGKDAKKLGELEIHRAKRCSLTYAYATKPKPQH